MKVLAVDPGPELSGFVMLVQDVSRMCLTWAGESGNEDLLGTATFIRNDEDATLVVEGVQGMGMPVGRETFETCIYIGRLWEAYGRKPAILYRSEVKLHLCGQVRAKDANVRAALIDRFGGSRAAAVGTKRSPGPLYGVRGHAWSALAVGVTWLDVRRQQGVRPVPHASAGESILLEAAREEARGAVPVVPSDCVPRKSR